MIITLKNADFSLSNIGTLNTYSIIRSLGMGAIFSGPVFVDKDAPLNATVTLEEGYELGEAGISIIMGGVGLTDCYTVVDNTITITITNVTGNVSIKIPTVNTSTGEEDDGTNNPEEGVIAGLGGVRVTSGNMTGAYFLENTSYTDMTYTNGTAVNSVYYIYDLIPVQPSTEYRIPYGRAYFELDSEGAQIGSRGNLTSGATDFVITTKSNTAYLSIAFKYEEIDPAEVQLQTRTVVVESEVLLSELTSNYVEGVGLDSASYADKADAAFYAYKDIPVVGGGTYSIPYARSTWFLDANKNGLYRVNLNKDVANWTTTVNANVAYISTCIKHDECSASEAKLITYNSQWVNREETN